MDAASAFRIESGIRNIVHIWHSFLRNVTSDAPVDRTAEALICPGRRFRNLYRVATASPPIVSGADYKTGENAGVLSHYQQSGSAKPLDGNCPVDPHDSQLDKISGR